MLQTTYFNLLWWRRGGGGKKKTFQFEGGKIPEQKLFEIIIELTLYIINCTLYIAHSF